MKTSSILPVALCVTTAFAFPALDVESRQIPVGFNEKAQRISVSGKHKFVAPDFHAGDQRGPCSGLNALANHGYLPHSGRGTIDDFIYATGTVFGLGRDVAAAVAVYGALFDGDGLSWSIGGPPKKGLTKLDPNLLGEPQGISFSHNNYEGDASATRFDLYSAGNDFKVDMSAFKELDDALPATDFATLVNHRNQRVQHSVHTNPYYFSGPFTGIAISGGANAFVYRLASNHSEEHPNGILTKEVFRSIWSVREDSKGELYWKPGFDRIPDNWYRRSLLEPYDFAFLGADLATYFVKHPDTVKVGGNLGKVDTFTGLDLANATGGVFNAADLAKGNNAACLAFQAATLGAPDLLSKVWKDISGPMAKLTAAFEPLIAKAECKKLQTFDHKALEQYPGYSKKYGYYQGR